MEIGISFAPCPLQRHSTEGPLRRRLASNELNSTGWVSEWRKEERKAWKVKETNKDNGILLPQPEPRYYTLFVMGLLVFVKIPGQRQWIKREREEGDVTSSAIWLRTRASFSIWGGWRWIIGMDGGRLWWIGWHKFSLKSLSSRVSLLFISEEFLWLRFNEFEVSLEGVFCWSHKDVS